MITDVPSNKPDSGSAADVDARVASRIVLDLTQDLADDGRGVALAEDEVARQMSDGAARSCNNHRDTPFAGAFGRTGLATHAGTTTSDAVLIWPPCQTLSPHTGPAHQNARSSTTGCEPPG